MRHLEADVLIIGAGGAGMYAAIEAARQGAKRVLLVDRSLIGRGGATVMAQMTVAAAVAPEGEDHWEHHLADTLVAGRGLCDPSLSALLCEVGAECIREMDAWKVGWARNGNRLAQVQAPGHDRPRCVYVDFLSTGPAVSRTLRAQVQRVGDAIQRIGEVAITDLVVQDGAVTGAVGLHIATGEALTIAAAATIIATGGLTRLYKRNSASLNMSGDGYALALRAGAVLQDMEFVQFFPIGHLAPRMIGMDPIMWDPFRYKLGGRLLNGAMEEFLPRWGGAAENGKYSTTRDLATYAIVKEAEAGRGSPAGGAWLSFSHVPAAELRAAFGPVIDRLAGNGIDLTRDAIEVSPIAHYHMGGIRVDTRMRTNLPGLLAAGEAVGGANGANRLSGNAITEALAFGRIAGTEAKRIASSGSGRAFRRSAALPALDLLGADGPSVNTAALVDQLQSLMSADAGPFRTATGLQRARDGIAALRAGLGEAPPGSPGMPHDLARLDWFDLRQMLLVAETVIEAAMARTESRGAHQREDFLEQDEAWLVNQLVTLDGGRAVLSRVPVAA
ncbi:FAD-binding protein [Roseococcus sp. YIM B11640]|uniref:FAD-binding protein n=1 Tax=Roseococcus sp. YIM B11640 TaxID=3133973 RepID=UPI003C7D0668